MTLLIVDLLQFCVCWILYKIRCDPMLPLNDELPAPYMPVWATRGALVVHWCSYAPPRCRTSQYRMTFVPLSVSLWNDLADPVFDGLDCQVSRAGPMLFHSPKLLCPYHSLLLFLTFSSSCLKVGCCGAGVFGLIGCILLSLSLALPTSFNNNNNNIDISYSS